MKLVKAVCPSTAIFISPFTNIKSTEARGGVACGEGRGIRAVSGWHSANGGGVTRV